MIKNRAQLHAARERKENILSQIKEIEEEYSGIEQEIYTSPLLDDLGKINNEIREYKQLTSGGFEKSIKETLDKPVLIENINELLAKIRIASGKTQSELAEEIGWEQPNVSRYENENYNSQTLKGIVEFTSALDVFLYVSPSLSEKPPEREVYVGPTFTLNYEVIEGSEKAFAFPHQFPEVGFTRAKDVLLSPSESYLGVSGQGSALGMWGTGTMMKIEKVETDTDEVDEDRIVDIDPFSVKYKKSTTVYGNKP